MAGALRSERLRNTDGEVNLRDFAHYPLPCEHTFALMEFTVGTSNLISKV
jgi:hypothetical protein